MRVVADFVAGRTDFELEIWTSTDQQEEQCAVLVQLAKLFELFKLIKFLRRRWATAPN